MRLAAFRQSGCRQTSTYDEFLEWSLNEISNVDELLTFVHLYVRFTWIVFQCPESSQYSFILRGFATFVTKSIHHVYCMRLLYCTVLSQDKAYSVCECKLLYCWFRSVSHRNEGDEEKNFLAIFDIFEFSLPFDKLVSRLVRKTVVVRKSFASLVLYSFTRMFECKLRMVE